MRRFLCFLALPLLAIFVVLSSCANQGEGERCELNAGNNGNDDCNAGLVCTPADQLSWPPTSDGGKAQTPQTPICCPADRSTATAPVCKLTTPPVGSDASIPETGGPDAPIDSPPTDAPSEAADAPTDTGAGDAPADTASE